jgi:hypothetical protein
MAIGDPIDYTSYYTNIVTALNTIATNSTNIKESLATIATQTTAVATKLGEIEQHQQKLRELGEGPGIHIISPYEYLGLISVYKSLIEEGTILKPATIQKSASKVATSKITEYLDAISALPKQF